MLNSTRSLQEVSVVRVLVQLDEARETVRRSRLKSWGQLSLKDPLTYRGRALKLSISTRWRVRLAPWQNFAISRLMFRSHLAFCDVICLENF